MAVQVFQDTSVVIPEIKTQGMQKRAKVSIPQPLGFAVAIGDVKHTSWYSLARLLSIRFVQSALPSSTFISIQIKFQAEAKFLGKSLYLNHKQVRKKQTKNQTPELAQSCGAPDRHQVQPSAVLLAVLADFQLIFSRLKFQHAKSKEHSNIAAGRVRYRKCLSTDMKL